MQLISRLSAIALLSSTASAAPNVEKRSPFPNPWSRLRNKHNHKSVTSDLPSNTGLAAMNADVILLAAANTAPATGTGFAATGTASSILPTGGPYAFANSSCPNVTAPTSYVTITESVTSYSYVYTSGFSGYNTSTMAYNISTSVSIGTSSFATPTPLFSNSTSMVSASATATGNMTSSIGFNGTATVMPVQPVQSVTITITILPPGVTPLTSAAPMSSEIVSMTASSDIGGSSMVSDILSTSTGAVMPVQPVAITITEFPGMPSAASISSEILSVAASSDAEHSSAVSDVLSTSTGGFIEVFTIIPIIPLTTTILEVATTSSAEVQESSSASFREAFTVLPVMITPTTTIVPAIVTSTGVPEVAGMSSSADILESSASSFYEVFTVDPIMVIPTISSIPALVTSTPGVSSSSVTSSSVAPKMTSIAALQPSSSHSIVATTTVTGGQTTGTPNPAAVHCGVHGLDNGNNFMGQILYEADDTPITLNGCYEECLGIYQENACVAYEFYYEEGLGAPRCNLFTEAVAYDVQSINNYIPNRWWDLACGVPVDA